MKIGKWIVKIFAPNRMVRDYRFSRRVDAKKFAQHWRAAHRGPFAIEIFNEQREGRPERVAVVGRLAG